ncbi:MAG: ankyrin repeat domain-containing protein [Ilumatobacteraceae bacterium]
MPVIPLPEDPDLAQLRRQAKELCRAVAAGEPLAVARVADVLGAPPAEPFRLSDAQLMVARRYGFASWPRLVAHVRLVNEINWHPEAAGPQAGAADELLRLACLSYTGDDGPARRAGAPALLAEQPAIARASVHTAAATADVDALRGFLGGGREAANARGGPFHWPPLMYLAYARHDPSIDGDAVAACAAALLDAGADPNAGVLWHGLPSPFTVITGLLGEGEQGPVAQPRHPHWRALTRLVLASGGEANDSQGLYNRMFEPGAEHLELLLKLGLGTGDGGPWRRRLGDALASPQQLVDQQLRWAAMHGMVDRVELLAAHGADGSSVVDAAARAGHAAVVDALVAAGTRAPSLDAVDRLIALLAAGDEEARAVAAAHPRRLAAAKRRRPSLLVDAVAAERPAAVRLLLDLGFDVDARGRGDQPVEGDWETPLHVAAGHGRVDLVRLLLDAGADPTVHDHRFDATPLGWAEHFDHDDVATLLRPLAPPS